MVLYLIDWLHTFQVHPYFRDLIDNNQSVWASVTFQQVWPSALNLKHFEK